MKEQLQEPIALLWVMLSPCTLFYFMAFSSDNTRLFNENYIHASSWFYAYMASSVALFGCSFYLIGRRESGFVRSFIYQRSSIALYLSAHVIGYSLIALCYATVFYLLTRPAFGPYSLAEFGYLLPRFLVCYTLFSSIGMLFALAPLKFATASTLFSILSFMMLSLSYLGASANSPLATVNGINPLRLAQLFIASSARPESAALGATGLLILCSMVLYKFLRIQPVWSRY